MGLNPMFNVTRNPTNGSAVSLPRVFFCKFDTVLYQFHETGTSDRTLIYLDQHLKWLGFSLYPLSFFLYSPFNKKYLASLYDIKYNKSFLERFKVHGYMRKSMYGKTEFEFIYLSYSCFYKLSELMTNGPAVYLEITKLYK